MHVFTLFTSVAQLRREDFKLTWTMCHRLELDCSCNCCLWRFNTVVTLASTFRHRKNSTRSWGIQGEETKSRVSIIHLDHERAEAQKAESRNHNPLTHWTSALSVYGWMCVSVFHAKRWSQSWSWAYTMAETMSLRASLILHYLIQTISFKPPMHSFSCRLPLWITRLLEEIKCKICAIYFIVPYCLAQNITQLCVR